MIPAWRSLGSKSKVPLEVKLVIDRLVKIPLVV